MDQNNSSDLQQPAEAQETKTFRLQKTKGNIFIQLIIVFLYLCLIGLVLMFIPLSIGIGDSNGNFLVSILGFGIWIVLIIALISLIKYLKKRNVN